MKCPSCGNSINDEFNNCPYCGVPIYSEQVSNSKISDYLSGMISVGSLILTRMNILFLVILNFIIVSFAINGIAFYTFGIDTVWCHYFVCALLIAYTVVKALTSERRKILKYIRRAVYIALITITVVEFMYNGKINPLLFIDSLLLIFLAVASFICLIFKGCTNSSFGLTSVLNTLISIIPLVSIHCMTETPDPLGVLMVYASFALSSLTLVNYVLLWILSMKGRIKSCF